MFNSLHIYQTNFIFQVAATGVDVSDIKVYEPRSVVQESEGSMASEKQPKYVE
jgi:hypothetical protein